MNILKFDLSSKGNKFKLLNATNGGPWHRRHANDQFRSNFEDYKAARIPYSRNHDSGISYEYGAPYAHDITAIFPDFNADANNPESYDFACTDESILTCLEAGTETFFRLGQSIEHHIKKHGTIPPKDFNKWAVICEHIIRHYNEGWADGYKLNIKYWEIWNEPDLDADDSPNKRTWGGTKAQFFDLYEIAAKHLKTCFPDLMIGGPALAYKLDYAEDFLCEMQKRDVPLDFFSWHIYGTDTREIQKKAFYVDELLKKYGFENAENILNEWNYVHGWFGTFVYSIESIIGLKGSSFIISAMCLAQHSPIDMLMYYDTRPSSFNGVFDYYTYKPLHGYYALYWYGMFYDMEREIPSTNEVEDIYSLCGVDENGKVMAMVTYYNDNDNSDNKELKLDFGKCGKYEVFLLDKDNKGVKVCETEDLTFNIEIHSSLLIKEI